MTYHVYGLIDPNTTDCRYVGKTNNLKSRYSAHIHDLEVTHKANWVRSLTKNDQKPVLVELESYATEEESFAGEIWWIAYMREIGCPLTNATVGGEGSYGHAHSEEVRERMSISHTGVKKSPSHVANNSAAKMGNKYGIGNKSHTGLRVNLGRKHTTETRANMSAAHIGNKPSSEVRARMSAAQRERWARRKAANEQQNW